MTTKRNQVRNLSKNLKNIEGLVKKKMTTDIEILECKWGQALSQARYVLSFWKPVYQSLDEVSFHLKPEGFIQIHSTGSLGFVSIDIDKRYEDYHSRYPKFIINFYDEVSRIEGSLKGLYTYDEEFFKEECQEGKGNFPRVLHDALVRMVE